MSGRLLKKKPEMNYPAAEQRGIKPSSTFGGLDWGHMPQNSLGSFISVHSLRAIAYVQRAHGIIWLFHVNTVTEAT
jgi:hypothetical protein